MLLLLSVTDTGFNVVVVTAVVTDAGFIVAGGVVVTDTSFLVFGDVDVVVVTAFVTDTGLTSLRILV